MCGIFGGIGNNVQPGIIRALALANRARGKDSLGFFNPAVATGGTGGWLKIAGDPAKALCHEDFVDYIDRVCRDDWFIAGHTRYATHGKVTTDNAHPFEFGRIIGTHNGIVDFPYDRNYQVDSQYLIDQLNRHNGDYQAALSEVSGYWGLAWYDGQAFYLQAHDNFIYVGLAENGAHYYSSDKDHLIACMGKPVAIITLSNGATIRFTADNPEAQRMPDIQVNPARKRSRYTWKDTASHTKRLTVADRATDTTSPITVGWPENTTGKKRKKRKNRKTDYVWGEELDYATNLAVDAGYADLWDFMDLEGFTSETAALAFLEDCAYVEKHGENKYSSHAQPDDVSGFNELARQRQFESFSDWSERGELADIPF